MATILHAHPHLRSGLATQKHNRNIWDKWLAIADSQAKNNTRWFVISLVVQGVLFLAIPAVLIFYYNAPIIVLAITLTLFFANFIAGMGGSGIRVTLSFFVLSVLVNLIMLAVFIL